jgi:hypothetical protein
MKRIILLLALLLPRFVEAQTPPTARELSVVTPAKGHRYFQLSIPRAGWPIAAVVTIEVYQSNDAGTTYKENPICWITAKGGVLLDETGKVKTHTWMICRIKSIDSNTRRIKTLVTVEGANIGAMTATTVTR